MNAHDKLVTKLACQNAIDQKMNTKLFDVQYVAQVIKWSMYALMQITNWHSF